MLSIRAEKISRIYVSKFAHSCKITIAGCNENGKFRISINIRIIHKIITFKSPIFRLFFFV